MKNTLGRKLLTALALGMLFTACKKDDVTGPGTPGGPSQPEESYFASKTNTVWKYRTDDNGEVSEHNVSVVSKKDSAGGKVVHYQTAFNDGTKIFPFVYANQSQIVFTNTMPSEMADQLDMIEEDPAISNLTVTGLPMLQKLPANPAIGNSIQFSDPLMISWTQTEDEEDFNVTMSFTSSEGKVLAFEDVTTPAGTFKNCMKWEYKSVFNMKIDEHLDESMEMVNTLWFAKGVGMVKSVQVTDNKTSTTVLTAIQ